MDDTAFYLNKNMLMCEEKDAKFKSIYEHNDNCNETSYRIEAIDSD